MRPLQQSPVSVSPSGGRRPHKLNGISSKDFRASVLAGLLPTLGSPSNMSHSSSTVSPGEDHQDSDLGGALMLVAELMTASINLVWREDLVDSDYGISSSAYSRGSSSGGLVGYFNRSISMIITNGLPLMISTSSTLDQDLFSKIRHHSSDVFLGSTSTEDSTNDPSQSDSSNPFIINPNNNFNPNHYSKFNSQQSQLSDPNYQ